MTLQTRLLHTADAVAGRFGMLDRPFSADALMAEAANRAGMDDFGDLSFVDPLRRFLAACDAEAGLGLVGRMATHWDMRRFLTNLLRLRSEEAQTAAILEQPVTQPIFIAGLPRSGTTFLHRLLMQDPANRGPLVWETIAPYPEPHAPTDRRAETVARQLRMFERLAPDFRSLHPLTADAPQECSEINAHVFRSLRFDSNYRVPSYRAWLDGAGHVEAYRFHRRFLQHLQHQAPKDQAGGQPRRWVLKCPDHVFALEAIRAVYPDARMVFVHRDPLKVLLSVSRLTEVLRAPFSRRVDRAEIGRQESDRYARAAALMVAATREQRFAEPILQVRYTDLIADPPATIAALYRHFGLTLGAEAALRVKAYIERWPNGGYGRHVYRFEDYQLDPAVERARFADYVAWFGLTEEAPRQPQRQLLPA